MIRLVMAVLLLFPGAVFCASFDCTAPDTPINKQICSDETLSKLDEQMAEYYAQLQKSLKPDEIEKWVKGQKKWLAHRSKTCPALSPACLIEGYKSRILEIRTASENLVPYTGASLAELQGIRGICKFDQTFPKDMRIYCGGAYSGDKLNRQIDQSGHTATRFDVVVNSPDYPVTLILGAYEPSVWNIVWTRGTRILAVVATGYHRQVVAGLPDSIPILSSSNDNQGPCGYIYITEKNLKKVNPFSQKIFERDVTMVHFASRGKLVFGSRLTREDRLYTSKDTPPDSFFDKAMPLAGHAGLNDLVQKGVLRRASAEDALEWAKLKTAQTHEQLPPVAQGRPLSVYKPGFRNGYVILKEMTIPAGLYGGNAVTFFLKKGVAYPEGNLGHCRLYDFNTLACTGVACAAN